MGKISIYDKVVIENLEKGKYGNKKIFPHKSPSKRSLRR